MTHKQDQRVSDSSTAIQAGRDVNYNSGISQAQFSDILGSVAQLVQIYTEQSRNLMEIRLQSFHEALTREFFEAGRGKADACRDPDFQGALLDAQKVVARSGNESLQEVLIDLVCRKSQCTSRDRLSLTLNDAISIAGSLTDEDFDFLALIFVFRYMQMSKVGDIKTLAEQLKTLFWPAAKNASEGQLAIGYLESHGCLKSTHEIINQQGGLEILIFRYPRALTKGVTRDSLEKVFPHGSEIWASDYIEVSPYGDHLLRVNPKEAADVDKFFHDIETSGNPDTPYDDLVRKHPITLEEFYEAATPYFEETRKLIEKYDSSDARNCFLSAKGIALAHARLSKFDDFDAPLKIWIR